MFSEKLSLDDFAIKIPTIHACIEVFPIQLKYLDA